MYIHVRAGYLSACDSKTKSPGLDPQTLNHSFGFTCMVMVDLVDFIPSSLCTGHDRHLMSYTIASIVMLLRILKRRFCTGAYWSSPAHRLYLAVHSLGFTGGRRANCSCVATSNVCLEGTVTADERTEQGSHSACSHLGKTLNT